MAIIEKTEELLTAFLNANVQLKEFSVTNASNEELKVVPTGVTSDIARSVLKMLRLTDAKVSKAGFAFDNSHTDYFYEVDVDDSEITVSWGAQNNEVITRTIGTTASAIVELVPLKAAVAPAASIPIKLFKK